MWQEKSRHMVVGVTIFLSGIAFAGSSESGTKELIKAVYLAIPYSEHQPDVEMRQQFASAILDYWTDFNTRVPRLSPAEQEWIVNELNGSGDRLQRAINSREFALRSLNSHGDQCIETAQLVLETYEVELRRELEMYHWLQMVNCYDGSDDIQIYLRQAGIPFNDDAGLNLQVPNAISLVQKAIVNKAASMAMAETMGWVTSSE